MKTSLLAAILVVSVAPAMAQSPAEHEQHHPGEISATQAQATPAQPQMPLAQSGSQMPMRQMMQGQGMMGEGMMQSRGMMQGQGRGLTSRFSPEDMSALADAHIAALRAGLKLSAEQEKLWPPVEVAVRNLATLHISHMQEMRQTRGMMTSDPVGMLRGMADHMSQGANAMQKLADAAAPLYATLDEAQKRRLPVLVPLGGRGMMSRGMLGPGGAMMPDRSGDDVDDENDR